jgi:type VI secretion system protein ImpG
LSVDEFLGYYMGELAFLREMGAEFAARYPKVAGRLLLGPDECEDPHVERLLEGFAFLTARIRRKIDDEFPEITDALLQVLYPHYQRPLPSMSVVQVQPGPDRSSLLRGYTIDRGARLLSSPVGGVRCTYRTTYPVALWPVRVESAWVQPDLVDIPGAPQGAVALIGLRLRCDEGTSFGQFPLSDPAFHLRFYLDGAAAVVNPLYELLLNRTCGVMIRDAGEGGASPGSVASDGLALRAVGFEADEGMFPYPDRCFPGYRLIQEYFAFPEKFLFVDVVGWHALAGKDPGPMIDILCFLDREPPSSVKVQAQTFRLGCTPIVNLFPASCEPIRLDQTRSEYRVIPDVDRQWAHEIYSIDEVTSTGPFLGDPVEYEPFYSLRHATGQPDPSAYWFASRRPPEGGQDAGTEVYLSFVNAAFRPAVPPVEAVSVRATCTNRDLPERLAFGGNQGDFELHGHGMVGRVARCLRKPTPTRRPWTGHGAQWRLISHLALNHLSLADSGQGVESLREILRLYDFADDAVSRQQIHGIRRVSSRPVAGRVRGRVDPVACLGIEVTVEFDDEQYVGSGVFLLASVLERFFGMYAAINSFSQLVATTRREGLLKRWPPRAGNRTLL